VKGEFCIELKYEPEKWVAMFSVWNLETEIYGEFRKRNAPLYHGKGVKV
jgi:hypothetical protein